MAATPTLVRASAGDVAGPFESHGVCSIGLPGIAGSLAVDGAGVLGGLSRLEMTLLRPGSPECDRLTTTGTLTLGGTLDLEEGASFVAVPGDTFVLLSGQVVSGAFGQVRWNGGPLPPGMEILYQPTRVVAAMTALVGVDDILRPTALAFRSLAAHGTIGFALDLPEAVEARVTLHDVSGRRVASVFEGRLDAGSHRLEARGSFAHGMYFARAEVRRAAGVTVLVAKVPYRR